MLIRNNISPIYISPYSDKNQGQQAKKSEVIGIKMSKLPIYDGYIRPQPILFSAKSQYKFDILRSENVKSIPAKYQISDQETIKLIMKAQTSACANKVALGAKYTQGYHGVAILIKDSKSKISKILSDRNLEINKSKTVCGEIRLILKLESAKMIDNVKALAISRPDIGGLKGESVSPCTICSAWLKDCYERNPNFKHMQYVLPEECGENKFKLKIMTLQDLLPQIDNKLPSYSEIAINKLVNESNIEYSNSAAELTTKQLSNKEIIKVLSAAKKAFQKSDKEKIYIKSKYPDENPLPAGAAVLTESGEVFPGCGMGPKARMKDPADKVSIINAKMNMKDKSKIKALAIFSENDYSLPSIEEMSWLLSPENVTEDFKIIKIENNKIKILTTKDFMPYAYKG